MTRGQNRRYAFSVGLFHFQLAGLYRRTKLKHVATKELSVSRRRRLLFRFQREMRAFRNRSQHLLFAVDQR